jgi:hypothetical protein
MTERFGDEAGFVSLVGEGEEVQGEYRCAECGYGVVVVGALPACPMCRGSVWEPTARDPFAPAARRGRAHTSR